MLSIKIAVSLSHLRGKRRMNKQGKRTGEDKQLRVLGGKFLQTLRKNAGLTQREVAIKLKLNYYTMISQIEAGSTRIPPDLFIAYSKALNVDQVLFVQKIMEFYDPHTYLALFGRTKLQLKDFMK